MTQEEILEDFPTLKQEHILAALIYYTVTKVIFGFDDGHFVPSYRETVIWIAWLQTR